MRNLPACPSFPLVAGNAINASRSWRPTSLTEAHPSIVGRNQFVNWEDVVRGVVFVGFPAATAEKPCGLPGLLQRSRRAARAELLTNQRIDESTKSRCGIKRSEFGSCASMSSGRGFGFGPVWGASNNRFRVMDGDGLGGGTWEDTGFDVVPMQWHEVKLVVDVSTQSWQFYGDGQRHVAPGGGD